MIDHMFQWLLSKMSQPINKVILVLRNKIQMIENHLNVISEVHLTSIQLLIAMKCIQSYK